MDDDMLILVDELDREQGFMEKQAAHTQAQLHRAFSVFLYKDGKMLIHRRALSKYHCGGMWANACCSHPRMGEALESAVQRRLGDELGIESYVDLTKIFCFVYRAPFANGLTEYELDHVFIGEYDGDICPNPNEIDDIRWISFEELRRELSENPDCYCPWFLACAPKVLGILMEEEPKPDASCNAGETLAWRYPQLGLAVSKGMSESSAYKAIVRKGQLPDAIKSPFAGEISLVNFATPAGLAELVFLPNRHDFEHFVQVMCHRCEPVQLPASMGAVTVFGANSWRRVLHHRARYEKAGNTDWSAEFKRFTQNKSNYQDILLAVTDGPYSGLAAADAALAESDWHRVSLRIRIYHELAHFISRTLYPNNRNTLRDEVLADCIGLLAATGEYNTTLAKRLLGVEECVYRKGGRLENYLTDGESVVEVAGKAVALVDAFAAEYAHFDGGYAYGFLKKVEENAVALELVKAGDAR